MRRKIFYLHKIDHRYIQIKHWFINELFVNSGRSCLSGSHLFSSFHLLINKTPQRIHRTHRSHQHERWPTITSDSTHQKATPPRKTPISPQIKNPRQTLAVATRHQPRWEGAQPYTAPTHQTPPRAREITARLGLGAPVKARGIRGRKYKSSGREKSNGEEAPRGIWIT